jgi:hypothetical protein
VIRLRARAFSSEYRYEAPRPRNAGDGGNYGSVSWAWLTQQVRGDVEKRASV